MQVYFVTNISAGFMSFFVTLFFIHYNFFVFWPIFKIFMEDIEQVVYFWKKIFFFDFEVFQLQNCQKSKILSQKQPKIVSVFRHPKYQNFVRNYVLSHKFFSIYSVVMIFMWKIKQVIYFSKKKIFFDFEVFQLQNQKKIFFS